MKGCLTTVIFLLNLSTFGTGIVLADLFLVPLLFGEDMSQDYDPTKFSMITLLVMFAVPILFLKLLFKGSKYLSEFICGLFSD